MSNAWVGAPGRTSTTEEMLAASGVETVNVPFQEIVAGALDNGRPRGRRSVGVEQVRRLVNLHVLLVGAALRIPSREPHRRIGQEQRDRMVKARIGIRAGRRE